jgi:homoaconitase/3-isopropylmalate dehydratase large subunit
MPYFKEGRETRKVKLPSNTEYWVEIYLGIKWGQTKHSLLLKEDGEVDMVLSADKMLMMIVKDWNLDGADGKVVEISEEAMDMLEPADALYLIKEAGADEATAKSSKKNSAKS